MEISVDFADGRIREFNTSTYTASDPFRMRNPKDPSEEALLTEFDLRLDLLEQEGLRLDIYIDAISRGRPSELDVIEELGHSDEKSQAQVAARHLYASIYLISKAELESATYVLVRRCGQAVAVAWRQGSGGWLVDGQDFAKLAREVYTDSQVVSTNSQVIKMVRYLSKSSPDTPKEDIVALTGFPLEAYLEAELQETAAGLDLTDDDQEEDLIDLDAEFEGDDDNEG